MLKVAVVILTVMLAYGCFYSLMGIVAPKLVIASSLVATAGKTLDDAKDAGYLKALTVSQRNVGVFALASAVSGFFVLFAAFQKAQKWAWWSFLAIGGIAWLGGLIITIAIGDKMNMIFHLIGLVIFLAGLLIPIKVFFAKDVAKA